MNVTFRGRRADAVFVSENVMVTFTRAYFVCRHGNGAPPLGLKADVVVVEEYVAVCSPGLHIETGLEWLRLCMGKPFY